MEPMGIAIFFPCNLFSRSACTSAQAAASTKRPFEVSLETKHKRGVSGFEVALNPRPDKLFLRI